MELASTARKHIYWSSRLLYNFRDPIASIQSVNSTCFLCFSVSMPFNRFSIAWIGIVLLIVWEAYINSPFFERAAPMAPVVFELVTKQL